MAALVQRVGDLTRVGDGPVATVYSGLRDGVPVALKVFPKRFDKRTMSALTKELTVLAGLRRVPSILPVDAVDELGGGEPALRMELCARSLAQAVSRHGPLPAEDVMVLGRAAALALAAAHEAGILHGGMSPHNVLFRASGEPVLADFGVTLRQAVARDPLHAIEFLPAETLRTGILDERTDLYGLGALLHYALSGRTPHPGRLGEQPGERVLRILGEPVSAISAEGVPVALSTLVARLLATNPANRPADAAKVAARLGDLLPAQPTQSEDDFDDFAMLPAPPSGLVLPPEAGPPPSFPSASPTFPSASPYLPVASPAFPAAPPAPVAPPASGAPPAPAGPPAPVAPPAPGVAAAFPAAPPAPGAPPRQDPPDEFDDFASAPPPYQQPPPVARPPWPPASAPPPPAGGPFWAPYPAGGPPGVLAPRPPEVAHNGRPATADQEPTLITPPAEPPTVATPPSPTAPRTPAAEPMTVVNGASPDRPGGPGSVPEAPVASAPPPYPVAQGPFQPAPAPLAPPPRPDAVTATPLEPAQAPPVGFHPPPPVAAPPVGFQPAPPPPEAAAPPPVAAPPFELASAPPVGFQPAPPPPEVAASAPFPPAPPSQETGLLEPAPAPPPPLQSMVEPPPFSAPAPREREVRAVPPPPASAPPALLQPEAGPHPAGPAPAPRLPAEPPQPVFAPSPLGGGTEFGDDFGPVHRLPDEPAGDRKPWGRVATASAALAGVVALVLVLLLTGEPDVLPASDREPDGGASIADVQVELSPPVDRTDHVELTWHSTRELDYAVVVAAEGQQTKVVLAHRRNSMSVRVEPGRKYCFMVQGTDSDRVYESDPVPLRGATCRK